MSLTSSFSHLVPHTQRFTASGGTASYDIYAKNTSFVVNGDSIVSILRAEVESHPTSISVKLVVVLPILMKCATYNGRTPSQ